MVRASWPPGPAREDTRTGQEDAEEDDLRTSEDHHCSAPELNQEAQSSTNTLSSDSQSLTIITEESFEDSDFDTSSSLSSSSSSEEEEEEEEDTLREDLPTEAESLLATGEDSSAVRIFSSAV